MVGRREGEGRGWGWGGGEERERDWNPGTYGVSKYNSG